MNLWKWQHTSRTNVDMLASHDEAFTIYCSDRAHIIKAFTWEKLLDSRIPPNCFLPADFSHNQMRSGYLFWSHREETGFRATGTLHPSPKITKTLNNREPRKVPKESSKGFNTSKAVSVTSPSSTHIVATLVHTILLLLLYFL